MNEDTIEQLDQVDFEFHAKVMTTLLDAQKAVGVWQQFLVHKYKLTEGDTIDGSGTITRLATRADMSERDE